MDFVSSLVSLVLTLLAAGIIAWIKRARLVVFVPRTFQYSAISEKGQIVEISVLNRGFKTEQDVEIELNPSLSYELLGANSHHATINSSKIEIKRIAASDDVTMLLIIENGLFKSDDIIHTVSKETKGTAVSKIEDIPPTGNQRITIAVALVVFSLVVTGFFYTIGFPFKKPTSNTIVLQNSSQTKDENKLSSDSLVVEGWLLPKYTATTDAKLLSSLQSGHLSLSISPIQRNGDNVSIPLKVTNNTGKVIRFSAEMMSLLSQEKFKTWELSFPEVMVMPGQTLVKAITVFIPLSSVNKAEKLVFIEARLATNQGETLRMSREITVD